MEEATVILFRRIINVTGKLWATIFSFVKQRWDT